MQLLQSFKSFIKQEGLFQAKDHLLLAVSGGVDSVVLCELCKQANFFFTIAHCNFQLRGSESERDERFVETLGAKYGVPVLVKKFEAEKIAKENKTSIQVAARELRYSWFKDIVGSGGSSPGPANAGMHARSTSPSVIVTAHHADDNIETVLMNFFKGTGIAGLGGILPKQGSVVRPLLFARKEELLEFSAQHHLAFVEDSSNALAHYTRNYFRLGLIPGLREVFPQVEENLINNIRRFREIRQLYVQSVSQHKKSLAEIRGNEVHIPVLKLKKTVPLETVVYEIIKDFGFSPGQVNEVIGLMDSESGKFIQSAAYRIVKHRNWLIISPLTPQASSTIIITGEDRKVLFVNGLLVFTSLAADICRHEASPLIAHLDAKEIAFPIILRRRKPGDYFYPLGMEKKKKLSRFLSDLRLPPTDKENIWVLEMNHKIIWVIGKRIDNRFKITDKTTRVLQISFVPGGGKTHQKEPA